MDTGKLKSYAPQARRRFIREVTSQAGKLGISDKTIEPATIEGDVLIIAGQVFDKNVASSRNALISRIESQGFEMTMEAAAYTWFNRMMALRYMEIHGFLDHGYRVLSHPEGKDTPEILDHAADVELPGLDKQRAIELKLDGSKDEELYRLLLLAQCNALNSAMPFLFDRLGSDIEWLLPANLLHSDSLIRQLVEEIEEEQWQEIEIVGWLYQFYISEKKDEVIGKVVKSEDIPAATQLFTPNWIVKYMVQNSLGAQWLATYPQSPLKDQMEYYIEPAEQTDEVNKQLAAITPDALNPEELTLMDPACGSGHILVESYELFKAIYLERGYRQRDVPQLILEENLFGLDIDDRAAQLTGFALMMKGRADDRRLFERGVTLNVMALVDSVRFDAEILAPLFDHSREDGKPGMGITVSDLNELKELFKHATTFGSLIQMPGELAEKLPGLRKLVEFGSQDLLVSGELEVLSLLIKQSELLVVQYDAVVANPPYMGAKAFPSFLKEYLKSAYRGNDKDLFAAFIARMHTLTKRYGYSGVMTSFVWMFITSFQKLRKDIIEEQTINSLVQLHYDAFADAKAHVCTFVLQNVRIAGQKSSFIRLSEFPGVENQGPKTLQAIGNRNCGWFFSAAQDEFAKIPGSPIAYWIRNAKPFDGPRIDDRFVSGGRTKTHGNEKFVRLWWEVDLENQIWVPYAMGGEFRKYAGNLLQVVDWSAHARGVYDSFGGLYSEEFWYKEGITWGKITSTRVGFREKPSVAHYDSGAGVIFSSDFLCDLMLLGFLNSPIVNLYLKAMNPTVNTTVNDVLALPLPSKAQFAHVDGNVHECVSLCRTDWNAYERSRDFQTLPLLVISNSQALTVESNYIAWVAQNRDNIFEMKRLEEENNSHFIDAYSLGDDLTPEVPIEQVTLTINPAYRYGGKLTDEEQLTRFRQDTIEELISYALGCTMGRYSLDELGIIYAHKGNEGFDTSRYTTFLVDDDGIIPLTDTEWFDGDSTNRIIEFISVVWNAEHLEENLTFLGDNLSPKRNETSRETIRRYLCDKFFKDHLQCYKKRPIYWLFSSGKQKAFQCLVYLHRYNEGTLARMRSEYVIPLQGKMSARIETLRVDLEVATSTSHSKSVQKELTKLEKQQTELITFDEKLRHFADQRITLDLHDGVKVNYGKFGDLLAEVKAVHGKIHKP